MSEYIKQQIIEALRQALNKSGNKAFIDSQTNVPVVTGNLKRSGSIIDTASEILIKYIVEYASIVERDWSGGMVWTDSYVKRNGTRVKGHYKHQPPREGKHFIENSLRGVFKGESGLKSQFQSNFLDSLRDLVSPKEVKEL